MFVVRPYFYYPAYRPTSVQTTNILSNNRFQVGNVNATVTGSPNASVIVGSQVGNTVQR